MLSSRDISLSPFVLSRRTETGVTNHRITRGENGSLEMSFRGLLKDGAYKTISAANLVDLIKQIRYYAHDINFHIQGACKGSPYTEVYRRQLRLDMGEDLDDS